MIVVVALIVGGVIWRARVTRRLTIEESVDQYRRTLGAVHDATTRARAADGRPVDAPGAPLAPGKPGKPGPPTYEPPPARPSRLVAPGSRRQLLLALMATATVIAVVVVITQSHGHRGRTTSGATTTTRPHVTQPTTTTRAAPSSTVAPVRATDASGTAFTVAKASYTLVVQASNGSCWVEANDAAGKSLFAGLVSSGQSQSITASSIKLSMGNPAAVKLSIDGVNVPFTLQGGKPITLQFTGTP
ncbi:MAG TPA: DUF4115 domain-containing protein [Acidimicrobiia bacterium]